MRALILFFVYCGGSYLSAFLIHFDLARSRAIQPIKLWEREITNSLVSQGKESDLLSKILEQVLKSQEDLRSAKAIPSLDFNKNQGGHHQVDTFFQVVYPLWHQSLPVGAVWIQFSKSSLVYSTLKTPLFLVLFFTGIFSWVIFLYRESVAKQRADQLESDKLAAQALVNLSKSVAHDLRSPLQYLKFYFEKEDSQSATSDLAIDATARIESIANNLLLAGRSPKEKLEDTVDSSSLEAFLKKLVAQKSQMHPDISFVLRANKLGSFSFLIPESQLSRFLMNVLDNSIQALNAESGEKTIWISAFLTPDGRLKIEILDTGEGIEEQNLDKCLQGGFTTKLYGNGLGLSGIQASLKRYQSCISMESKVGVGTKVTFDLAPKFSRS